MFDFKGGVEADGNEGRGQRSGRAESGVRGPHDWGTWAKGGAGEEKRKRAAGKTNTWN